MHRRVKNGAGYEIYSHKEDNGELITMINHPNLGWCPWFTLKLHRGRWVFIKDSSATEDWVINKLTGVKGLHRDLRDWIKQRRQ